MIKKAFFYIIILFNLTSCGYEPMYLEKAGFSTSIKSFQLEGDKKINRKIILSLNVKSQIKETGYKLLLDSNKTIETVSKNSAGDASAFRTLITVNVSLLDSDKIFKTKTFTSNFTYNNIKNKYDLSQYQKDIETNLINKIVEEIFIFLTL
jgi:hypothetical protein